QTDTDAFSATYVLTQDDIDAGGIENQALVEAEYGAEGATVTDLSGTDLDNDAPTVLPLDRTLALSLVKEADATALSAPPLAGEEIAYSFTVTNTGNVTLTDVTVTDDLPGLDMPTTVIPLM